MNLPEILDRLDKFCTWTKEGLDKEAVEWGKLKARKEHEKEIREIFLSKLKIVYSGSDASRTTEAKASPEWEEFMEGQTKQLAEYHTADYKKGFKEKLIEVLRSLLSYNKSRIGDEI